jgi:hypothetical protein
MVASVEAVLYSSQKLSSPAARLQAADGTSGDYAQNEQ